MSEAVLVEQDLQIVEIQESDDYLVEIITDEYIVEVEQAVIGPQGDKGDKGEMEWASANW